MPRKPRPPSPTGKRILVLSDRDSNAECAPIPSLLLTSAVHHHLIREKTRTKVGLIVETGDAREVHHMALLIGYGAGAINPYLAFETIEDLIAQGLYGLGGAGPAQGDQELHQGRGQGRAQGDVEDGHLHRRVVHAARRCSRRSACPQELVDEYFTGTVSRLGGIGLDEIAEEVARRHRVAYSDRPDERAHRDLELGGEYQWRREGEYHLFNPETVFKLQHATRAKRYDVYKEYTRLVDDQSRRLATLRGLFTFRDGVRAAGADRRGRAGQRDRQALRHRRDVVRLDLEGSARDAGHRHEPHRRQVEHRRGRRGRRPLRAATPTATCAARRSSRSRRAASA